MPLPPRIVLHLGLFRLHVHPLKGALHIRRDILISLIWEHTASWQGDLAAYHLWIVKVLNELNNKQRSNSEDIVAEQFERVAYLKQGKNEEIFKITSSPLNFYLFYCIMFTCSKLL
jgi:hypothetical protein